MAKAIRRLTMLRQSADATPVPKRKFFHIGKPEKVDDVGECIPMLSWVDDNLSRFVIADRPTSGWGDGALLMPLPNWQVAKGDGIFLITSGGDDRSEPHPNGEGKMHFIHLGRPEPLMPSGAKLYVYRLDGVQMKPIP